MTSGELSEAVVALRQARFPLALTGAGISVGSGIPDFRSPGGLWERFPPDQFATLEAFLNRPEETWTFYRELGQVLRGPFPNEAHQALARLERENLLEGVITQNIDGLHRAAGSEKLLEVHGNYEELLCLRCSQAVRTEDRWEEAMTSVPCCRDCEAPLKPDVVLFGESIREGERASEWIQRCDLLLLIGTSGMVYPVAEFPVQVVDQGGKIIEFNRRTTQLSELAHFRIRGLVEESLSEFCRLSIVNRSSG